MTIKETPSAEEDCVLRVKTLEQELTLTLSKVSVMEAV